MVFGVFGVFSSAVGAFGWLGVVGFGMIPDGLCTGVLPDALRVGFLGFSFGFWFGAFVVFLACGFGVGV